MLLLPDALALVLAAVRPRSAIRLPLDSLLGSVLAEDVRADRDLPAADRAAMDGYAIRAEDAIRRGTQGLRLVGEIAAGCAAGPTVVPGSAVRIYTGGNLPPGADTVVMQEDAVEADGHVSFRVRVAPGQHVTRRACDARAGDTLLAAGTALGPAELGICATVGLARPLVHAAPRVVVISTGSELREVTESVADHTLRCSSGPAIAAALRAAGLSAVTTRLVPDDPERLTDVLAASLASGDAVILTGGVSVGRYDLVPGAVARVGALVHFHGLALRPGKPTLFATVADALVFGLPGRPLAALAVLHALVLPALRRMAGAPGARVLPSLPARLDTPVTRSADATRLVPVRLAPGEDALVAAPLSRHGTGELLDALGVDGVVAVAPGADRLPEGAPVRVQLWRCPGLVRGLF